MLGTGVGAVVAVSKNGDIAVQQELKPQTSAAKSMALGAGIGLVLAIVAIAISQGTGGFGH